VGERGPHLLNVEADSAADLMTGDPALAREFIDPIGPHAQRASENFCRDELGAGPGLRGGWANCRANCQGCLDDIARSRGSA